MTARKPPNTNWQSWIDLQIEEGRAAGAFDDLPGMGKPLTGLGEHRDELWWVRDKLKREDIEYLPPALRIAREREDALTNALAAPSEQQVRSILDAVNTKIRYANSHVIEGPPSTSVVIDVESVVSQWRAQPQSAPPSPPDPAPAPPQRPRRWWQRERGAQ